MLGSGKGAARTELVLSSRVGGGFSRCVCRGYRSRLSLDGVWECFVRGDCDVGFVIGWGFVIWSVLPLRVGSPEVPAAFGKYF